MVMRSSIERTLETVPLNALGIVLHATELGRPVYLRMEFEDVSSIEIFVHKSPYSAD